MSAISSIYNQRGKRRPLLLFLRESRPAHILICVGMGAAVGVITGLLHALVSLAHSIAFALPHGEHLSATDHIDKTLLFAVPVLGGLVLGLFNREMKRRKVRDIVDPIEANAIYGGRMSVMDSLRLLAATLISNGSGISVGMEAAYTQVGACFLSWAGGRLLLRRADMRIFVAAGAAAAIAAAYNAPLAGAFYGYELVLGAYTIAALPQVTLCALTAALVLRFFTAGTPIFSLPMQSLALPVHDYLVFGVVGILSSAVGIVTMKAVTGSEVIFRRLPLPDWLRPAAGGLIVGAIACFLSPQVLGSGQGGIDSHLHSQWPLNLLVLLLVGKIAASALSIGSGFRGGLFSAALFLGCLLGQISGLVASHIMPVSDTMMATFMLVGTGSVAAAVIGAPMTMIMLVLEMTGNFPAMTAVLAGALVASTVTRYSFGYSFATWRFHLKGLGISGARDVGWVRDLTVERLMMPTALTELSSEPLSSLRQKYPATGSVRNVFLVDAKGNYEGVLSVTDMHNPESSERLSVRTGHAPGSVLAQGKAWFLIPPQNIQEALRIFAEAQLEELPVLASAKSRKIIGYAREAHLLKRYSQELEASQLSQT